MFLFLHFKSTYFKKLANFYNEMFFPAAFVQIDEAINIERKKESLLFIITWEDNKPQLFP